MKKIIKSIIVTAVALFAVIYVGTTNTKAVEAQPEFTTELANESLVPATEIGVEFMEVFGAEGNTTNVNLPDFAYTNVSTTTTEVGSTQYLATTDLTYDDLLEAYNTEFSKTNVLYGMTGFDFVKVPFSFDETSGKYVADFSTIDVKVITTDLQTQIDGFLTDLNIAEKVAAVGTVKLCVADVIPNTEDTGPFCNYLFPIGLKFSELNVPASAFTVTVQKVVSPSYASGVVIYFTVKVDRTVLNDAVLEVANLDMATNNPATAANYYEFTTSQYFATSADLTSDFTLETAELLLKGETLDLNEYLIVGEAIELLETYKSLKVSDYTLTSWNNFVDAYNELADFLAERGIIEIIDSARVLSPEQPQLNTLVANLRAARGNLVSVNGNQPVVNAPTTIAQTGSSTMLLALSFLSLGSIGAIAKVATRSKFN